MQDEKIETDIYTVLDSIEDYIVDEESIQGSLINAVRVVGVKYPWLLAYAKTKGLTELLIRDWMAVEGGYVVHAVASGPSAYVEEDNRVPLCSFSGVGTAQNKEFLNKGYDNQGRTMDDGQTFLLAEQRAKVAALSAYCSADVYVTENEWG